ncbi:MAG: hypothetical protein Q9227_004276 [Pyrenula ochraceoflavens]
MSESNAKTKVETNGNASHTALRNGLPHDLLKAPSTTAIRAALDQLRKEEAAVTARLDAFINSQKDFERELGKLDVLRADLSSQTSKTRSISGGMLSDAAATASRISGSVHKLDLQQSRVKATLEVVEQVSELKTCVLGVTGSMGAPQDWETAASYINRASKIPPEVLNGPFAARMVPTAEVPDVPSVTLTNASESLCALFLKEFDKAVKEGDGAKITRFFKLFPLIGKSDIGLDVYSRYVCQGIAQRARSNLNAGTGGNQSKDGFFYGNALTRLFEHIAQIIDGHGSLVERHYGAGSMIRVIERLQVEADVQGGIILDTWADERNLDRKLTDIRSYAFTFLVQSFLPAQRGNPGTPRSNSPANFPGGLKEDESVDMKEVDALLNEITLMLGRWSLYVRFMTDKCKQTPSENFTEQLTSAMPQFVEKSSLLRKVNDRLITPFNSMTTFFFRRSVEKAFQLDEQPPDLSLNPSKPLGSNPPHITSAVDDIMYIFNKVLQQSLDTSQRGVINNIVPTLGRVMGSDFIGMIQRKMRDEVYPRAAIKGALPPEHLMVAFLVLINDLDIAVDYVKRIIDSQTQQAPMPSDAEDALNSTTEVSRKFPIGDDAEAVTAALKSMSSSFVSKSSELLGDGIQVVFENAMKPRLRPILMDAFRDTDYQATEEELAELARDEERDEDDEEIVGRRFRQGWDALTRPIARIMTPATFDLLLNTIVSYLCKMIEKRLWGYYGRVNEAGAVRLERDVNSIINTIVQGRRYALRESFAKCSQICMIMNMETDEWEEVQQSQDQEIADKLTEDERLRARAMVKEVE